ncbi:MAG: hypothetical protein ACOC84_07685, partial [Actinomycetota bacterium]
MPENIERLSEVGPLDPRTGYPLWYEDSTGVRLELVWEPGDDNAPVAIDPEESGPLRDIPLFPGESFYFSAETDLPIGGGEDDGEARVILALEATFGGNEEIRDGQQIVFGRIRFRIKDGRPETTYMLTHPYGTAEVTTDDDGDGTVTQDIGVTPLGFEDALAGQIAPFLRWTPFQDAPEGYIGDGTTRHTVTGSPFSTNFALVEGTGAGTAGGDPDPQDPGNRDKVHTDEFVVQGRLAGTLGAEVTRAVYRRTAAGDVTVDVFARTAPGQQLLVTAPGLPDTPMEGGESTNYIARLAGADLPQEVTVTNRTDVPPWSTTVPVTDVVEITRAEYAVAAQTLTVTA